MKEEFPLCNVKLIPDMVLYLDNMKNNTNRENALFCIRKDKEKVNYDFNTLEKLIIKNGIERIDYTDTVIKQDDYNITKNKEYVENKLIQFSKYKLIVTDRLHGMVFALLSNTPCLVLENINYKL